MIMQPRLYVREKGEWVMELNFVSLAEPPSAPVFVRWITTRAGRNGNGIERIFRGCRAECHRCRRSVRAGAGCGDGAPGREVSTQ